jgi:predicted alpha-1,2-mannosidase
VGAYFRYNDDKKQTVYVKVGISYVSIANARDNLQKEQPKWKFSYIKKEAREKWNKELSRIEVQGGTKQQKTIFYTGLYHMLLQPSIFSDVNGDYLMMGHDGVAKVKEGHNHYSVFSLWDTYRNLHPFLTLFYPARQTDMVRSMLAMYKQNGWLPKWELASSETYVMVGDPAVPAIADTWLNGLHSFDKDIAYRAMTHESMDTSDVNPIRPGLKIYLKKHYIPVNTKGVGGGVSTTLEYNFADYALAQFDSATGHTKDVTSLIKRSKYYKNLYDNSSGFLRPKTANGNWYSPFDPATKNVHTPGFVEGNAWSYLFFVPHDIYGMAKLMGGRDQFIKRLQESFDKGYFVMWNEPDMAYPYLFTYFDGESWRTQKAVRETMKKDFTSGPGGLPGNDDTGVTSAWYVFGALGFYPANPASGKLRLGSPVFKKITIHLNQKYYNGKTFTIKAPKASNTNIYIQSVAWNDLPYQKPFITHQMIEKGGNLILHMGAKPDKKH